jgi:predicted phosphohydrolase
MTQSFRIAVTADLHWGPHPNGDAATMLLVEFLLKRPLDLLILAGDIGAGDAFGPCLQLFADLPCPKAVVPGNHDIWVTADDPRGDSLTVYRELLPRLCREYGFHYLDSGPLLLGNGAPAIVGSINWYDYSWSIEQLREQLPDYESRLKTKVFSRGRHNDARFVRWPLDDVSFTTEVVQTLERHLVMALESSEHAIVVTHHPPLLDLGFPRIGPDTIDRLLWRTFTGNRSMEALLRQHASRIPFVFCGHTHLACEATIDGMRGYNVGSDYPFKRLLILDWPKGEVDAQVFGKKPG